MAIVKIKTVIIKLTLRISVWFRRKKAENGLLVMICYTSKQVPKWEMELTLPLIKQQNKYWTKYRMDHWIWKMKPMV